MCDCNHHRSMDINTPRNVYFSAFFKRSFAFYTVKNRLPVILTKTLDNLVRNKDEIGREFGEDAKKEIKNVIGELSKLKYEVLTNKPLTLLQNSAPDIEHYNERIQSQAAEDGQITHFHTIFLLAECYMYRRINQIFELTNSLKKHDYFRSQKIEAYFASLPLIHQLGKYLFDITKDDNTALSKKEFISLLKLNLWGNKCDLSITLGKIETHTNLLDTSLFETKILCDHSEKIFRAIDKEATNQIVDIILDNAGYELFSDLCLADYVITKKFAAKVRFYVKAIPWFISDAMSYDIYWIIDQLKNSNEPILMELNDRWSNYLHQGVWTIEESDFWTLPLEFTFMASLNPDLYKKIAEAKIAIFKGDLNYRKLFGEKNWDPTTPIDVALQNFNPTKVVALRTLKCDIMCGIEKVKMVEEMEAKDPTWKTTGEYGLIQFSEKIVHID